MTDPLYVAPTEPWDLKKLGISTLLPEEYGVDIYWESYMGKCGIQRKRFPDDFLASVFDGRLNREYAMMKGLDLAILLLEGKGHWTVDGRLLRPVNGKRWAWTEPQHRAYLASVQLRGIQVHTTHSLSDTVAFIDTMRMWSNKTNHNSLSSRPGPKGTNGFWGDIDDEDYQLHMIQGIPGISVKRAKAIMEKVGFPFMLSVSKEELLSVPGIGKGLADRIWNMFNKKETNGSKSGEGTLASG